MQDKV